MPWRVLILSVLTTLWVSAEPLEGWVRVRSLGDAQVPVAYPSKPSPGRMPEPITAEFWSAKMAGFRAELSRQGDLTKVDIQDGPTLWIPEDEWEYLEELLQDLPPKRDGGSGYWWNQLLDEYERRGLLIRLVDDSATEMTFTLNLLQEEVAQAMPVVLAEAGLPLEDAKTFDGFTQFRTGQKQERTPGFFNPPYRRFTFLINTFEDEQGARLNIRATVFSFQRRKGYGSSWQADLSPGIRQRIRQLTAELLTKTVWPERWRSILSDYECGYALPEFGGHDE